MSLAGDAEKRAARLRCGKNRLHWPPMNGLAAAPLDPATVVGCKLSCPHTVSANRNRQETLQAGLLALPARPAFPPLGSGSLDRTFLRGSQRRDRSGFSPDSLLWRNGHLKDI